MATRAATIRPAFRTLAVSLAILVIAFDFGEALAPLIHASDNRFVSNEVGIAQYLRVHSSPRDTIYAAHNYPAYAFYTERKTVSLPPIQNDFDSEWRERMSQPGFLVYTHPDRLREIHAINPAALKPGRSFLEMHREFRAVQEFPTATVYRYDP